MKHFSSWQKRKGCHGNDNGNDSTATFQFRDVQRPERLAAGLAPQGHGDGRQQEGASGGRATTRRSCSGSCKWWTDAGSDKALSVREKELARGKEK
ncbi:hypothetical protein CFC21_035687 [Triticum aestivum]|uniref:Uncharacterized protein n=2 Tax=Triticum aestivum TaxID=4565 RepID=A0A9R1F7S1_WHEAT|nr:hypothetical protein CFC21_035687 [Triticum aestivum]